MISGRDGATRGGEPGECGMQSAVEEHDEYLKTIEKLYGASFRDIFNVVNAPCGEALDQLWREVILSKNPEYGDWEYPGQAYRHLKKEFEELRDAAAAIRLQTLGEAARATCGECGKGKTVHKKFYHDQSFTYIHLYADGEYQECEAGGIWELMAN